MKIFYKYTFLTSVHDVNMNTVSYVCMFLSLFLDIIVGNDIFTPLHGSGSFSVN